MKYSVFYVGTRPRAMWGPDLHEQNLAFLRGMDSSYYSYISKLNEPRLDGESKLQAAAALRIAYSQGIETLMALACASMQAPDCVIGWMTLYRNQELLELVKSVSKGRAAYPIHPWYEPGSWDSFAGRVFERAQCGDTLRMSLQERFGELWSRFASDFTDENHQREYNALKHGTRPRLGGFHLSFGPQPEKGVPPAKEDMVPLGGSDFGSTYFRPERIGDSRLHLRPVSVSVNWVPENMVEGLLLLDISVRNLLSYLKSLAGAPIEECEASIPDEDFMYDLPWAKQCGVINSSFRFEFGEEHVASWDEDEIRAMVQERWTSSS